MSETSKDTHEILAHLRQRDRDELVEYGFDLATAAQAFEAPAVISKIFFAKDVPEAIIAFHQLTPKAVAVSLMATQNWPRVARALWRWGQTTARPELLRQGFTRAECRTLEGHADAIAFLERLGFVRECHVPNFGATGASFIQYAWRLNDHVPHQTTQSASATASTPAP